MVKLTNTLIYIVHIITYISCLLVDVRFALEVCAPDEEVYHCEGNVQQTKDEPMVKMIQSVRYGGDTHIQEYMATVYDVVIYRYGGKCHAGILKSCKKETMC